MAGHLARNQVHAGSIPAALTESADEWSSTGPENRGGGDEPQRFDSSALVCDGPVRLPARSPLFQGGQAGSTPARVTTCRVRLVGRGRCPLKAETRVRIPHATQASPRQVDRGQDYESRLRRSNRLGGSTMEATCMSVLHSRLLTGRTTVPEVRLLSLPPFAPLDRRDRRRAATSSHAGASPARSSDARKVFAAACLTASQRDRVRFPVRAHRYGCPSGQDPVFQTGDASSILAPYSRAPRPGGQASLVATPARSDSGGELIYQGEANGKPGGC